MQDGTGATGFKYVPAGAQGAGQLAEEDSPDGGNATIKNSYDELGRLSTRQLGTATESLTYDALGRVTQDQSALGTFQYSYLGQTNQVTNEVLQGGNWQTVNTYGTNAQDRQLQSISHQAPLSPFQQFINWLISCFSSAPTSTSTVPTITYQTGPEQQILARTDEQGMQSYGYDADQRLTTVSLATQISGSHSPHNEHGDFMSDQNPGRGLGRDNNDQYHGGGSSLLSTNYTYDPASNLTMVQKGITSTAFTVGADNDVQSKNNIGWLSDANGNVLDDGRNSYLWDAENRLIQITNKTSGQVSQFKYDGLSRRTAIIETTSATATPQETHYLWCGSKPCESHTPSGQSRAQFFAQGEIVVGSAAPHYYAQDHLGSVVQVVDANGATQGTQQYDAYGIVTQTSGIKPIFGYAGMFQHDPSGLNLTWFRAYDPTSARWLSKDPIAEAGGLNLYGYVGGNPINRADPFGLDWIYKQSTGQLTHVDPNGSSTNVGNGYAGHGQGVNNPAMQNVSGTGPLPQGSYSIGDQQDNRTGGGTNLPGSMRLTPNPSNNMFGRAGFLIHGDNSRGNRSASEGCMIFNRGIRNLIGNSGDNTLRVIP